MRIKEREVAKCLTTSLFSGRDEATRTPDPYVPNVVRYQLRYIPKPAITGGFLKPAAKVRKKVKRKKGKGNYLQF